MFQNQFINAFSRFEGFFGYLGGVLITDNRIQRGHHADTIVYIAAAYFLVSGDSVDTESTQSIESVHQQIGRLKATLRHNRLHRIQFHLRGFTAHGYTKVIAYYFVIYLVHHFGDNGVYLARHYRGTRLHGRKIDFSQSTTRPGCEQTKVVAYLVHLHRHSPHRRRITYKTRSIRSSPHQISG